MGLPQHVYGAGETLPKDVSGTSYTRHYDTPFPFEPSIDSFNGTKIHIEMTHTPASGDSAKTDEEYDHMVETVLIDRSQCIFATMF